MIIPWDLAQSQIENGPRDSVGYCASAHHILAFYLHCDWFRHWCASICLIIILLTSYQITGNIATYLAYRNKTLKKTAKFIRGSKWGGSTGVLSNVGIISIQYNKFCGKFSRSLECPRFVCRIVRSLSNLTGDFAALVPSHLSNFRAIRDDHFLSDLVGGVTMLCEIVPTNRTQRGLGGRHATCWLRLLRSFAFDSCRCGGRSSGSREGPCWHRLRRGLLCPRASVSVWPRCAQGHNTGPHTDSAQGQRWVKAVGLIHAYHTVHSLLRLRTR